MNLHRILTLCMLLPLAIAYGYAQHAKHSTEITVFFRVNSSNIDLGYFGNAESLTSLDKTIDMFRMNIDSVSIVAYASPEGNFAYNVALSSKRAAAMHNFLVNRYNDVDFKNIKEVVGGPDFDGLSRRIEADSQVPYRKEVLDIVRNWGSDPVATFRKLKALRNGVPYNYISYHYLPWLRTATTVIFHYNASVSLYKEQNQQITVSENSSYVLPEASSYARARARDDERDNQSGAVSVACTGTENTAGNNDNPLAGLPGSNAPAGNTTAVPVHGNQPAYSVLPILDQQAGSDAEAVFAAGYAAGYAAASSGAPYGQGVYANQPQGGSAGQGGAAGATGAGAAAGAGAAGTGVGAAAYGQGGQGGQGGTGAAAGAAYGQSTQGSQSGAAAGNGAGAGASAAGAGYGQGSQSGAGTGTGAAAYGQGGQGSQSGAGTGAAGAGYAQGGQGSNAGQPQGSNAGAAGAAGAGYGDSNNKDNKGGQDGAKSFTFVFSVGGSEIDTTRADNAEALQALRQALADGYMVEGSSVMVHAYASPDGPAKANKMLSQRRAESAVVFLEDVLPEDTKVDYVSEGENWEGFKESVEKNYNRPDRDKVLAILSSDKSVDEKKKEINKLDPESRKELVGKTSESLRSVKVTLLPPEEKPEEKAEEKTGEKAEPVVAAAPVKETTENKTVESKVTESKETESKAIENEVKDKKDDEEVIAPIAVDTTSAVAAIAGKFAADSTATVAAVDSVAGSQAVDSTVTVAIDSTVVAPVDSLANQAAADSTKPRKPHGTIVALKTNLLYDLVTALNVEVEVPIAKRFSIAVENVFPWWETGNKYCFQLWEMGIEGRIWLKAWDVRGREKLRGLFAGIYGMSGKYDFQYDRKINYQGEFWSAGATIGYSITLGRKEWGNLEFSVSDGYLQSPYRHYYPTGDYSKLLRDRGNQGTLYSYFVYPTKAKVSLVIPIPGKKKKEANYE